MTPLTLIYYILGILTIIGGFSMLFAKHPMRAALSLLFVMFILAVLYALLAAPVIAVLQIIIYSGAIMTLIVFIVTLLDSKEDDLRKPYTKCVYLVTFLMFFLLLVTMNLLPPATFGNAPMVDGNIGALSKELLTNYVFHFELASVLLLVGIIGISIIRAGRGEKQ